MESNERCMIVIDQIGPSTYMFRAKAIGPAGEFSAGNSHMFHSDGLPSQEGQAAEEFKALWFRVLGDGWRQTIENLSKEWEFASDPTLRMMPGGWWLQQLRR